MPEKSFPDISDAQILAELHAASKEVDSGLRNTLTEPLVQSAQRITAAIRQDPGDFLSAANFHPVIEIPYTGIPPDMSFGDISLDRGCSDDQAHKEAHGRIAAFWPQHMRHNNGVAGCNDLDVYSKDRILNGLEKEMLSHVTGAQRLSSEQWQLYQQAHELEHQRDYCTLGAFAAGYARRRHDDSHFVDIERTIIEKYFTFRYPTALYINTSSEHFISGRIAMPLDPESDRAGAEKLLRGVAFIIDHLQQDEELRYDMSLAAQKHPELLEAHTLRAKDTPCDLPRSLVHGTQESVGVAILPMAIELLRGKEATLDDLVAGDHIRRVTRRAALGYVGPVANQGVGMASPPMQRSGHGKLELTPEARQSHKEAQAFWRREYHYPLLVAARQAKAEGKCPEADSRTGLYCPLSQSLGRIPSVITTYSKTLLAAATKLELSPGPSFSRQKPYRPWEVPGFKQHC